MNLSTQNARSTRKSHSAPGTHRPFAKLRQMQGQPARHRQPAPAQPVQGEHDIVFRMTVRNLKWAIALLNAELGNRYLSRQLDFDVRCGMRGRLDALRTELRRRGDLAKAKMKQAFAAPAPARAN